MLTTSMIQRAEQQQQQQAERYVKATEVQKELDKKRMDLENEINRNRDELRRLEEALGSRVGQNTHTKVFIVGHKVVVVKHNVGVAVYPVERKA